MKTCKRCKREVAKFPITKSGKPSTMCEPCYIDTAARNAAKHEAAKLARKEAPEGELVCLRCKKSKPLNEFEVNAETRRLYYRSKPAEACKSCREYMKAKTKQYREAHSPERRACDNSKRLAKERQLRTETLAHYGDACKCCGEDLPEFLALDHVHNDGNKHRELIGGSSYALYVWAKKHNYPDTLQVLCHNCNVAKAFYGICPHQTQRLLLVKGAA